MTAEVHSLKPSRRSLIERFVELTEGIEAPRIFRRWTAVSIVSGALERKCYTTTWDRIYPNLFVVLVGPPGVGKSVPVLLAHRLWVSCKEPLNVAPTTVTKAALIDHYSEAGLRVITETQDIFYSCLVAARELGHLVPEYDLEFLNVLNDLYDCIPVPYVERTRGKGVVKIDSPHLVILAATQPKFLASTLPETAYGLGTTSRMIMIYSGDVVRAPLWREEDAASESIIDTTVGMLQPDVDRIAALHGEFSWTPEARKLMNDWLEEGEPPKPTHHRLQHYSTRRRASLLKLGMVMSAAEGDSLRVEKHHLSEAMRTLFEAESWMPDIFKDMGAHSQGSVIEDCFVWMMNIYNRRGQQPIPETRVARFLQQRLPAAQIQPTMDAMIRSETVKVVKPKGEATTIRMLVPIKPEDLLEGE